ncbi:MAG: hypothetical protein QF609_08680 [Gammaproteobacteria bacterium]|nr:hypothetical protein [Gammaproteobacteria bacterium]
MKKTGLMLILLLTAGLIFAAGEVESTGSTGPVTISVAATQPPWITTIKDSKLTDLMEEELGFTFDFTVIPLQEAKQQVKLLIASGQYPSLFMNAPFIPADELEFGVEGGVLIPLNAYITEERTPNIVKAFEEFPQLKAEVTAPDGNIYVLAGGGEGGCYHCSIYQKFWINQNWLDALNLDMPSTTDDYRDALRAFKTGDPNGNGLQDEIPLTGATNGWYTNPSYFIAQAFVPYAAAGSGTKMFGVDGDEVYFPYNDSRFKDALVFMNELLEEGLLDPNAYIQTGDQLAALGGSSADAKDVKIGSFPGGGPMIAFASNNPVAENFSPVPPFKGPTGIQTTAGYPYGTRRLGGEAGVFALTNKASQAEIDVAMSIMNWAFSFEGANHVNNGATLWRRATTGELNAFGEQASVVPLERPGTGDVKWEMPVYLSFPAGGWGNGFEGEVPAIEILLMTSTRDVYEKYKDATGIKMLSDFIYMDPENARRVAQVSAELRTFVEQQIALFVTGQKDIESGWSSYVGELDQIGLSEITDILNDNL